MGQIIPFQREARRRAPPSRLSTSPRGDAEILFFLGVRYCRDDNGGKDNEPTRPSSPRSRRKKRA